MKNTDLVEVMELLKLLRTCSLKMQNEIYFMINGMKLLSEKR